MDELVQYIFRNYSGLLNLKEHVIWQYYLLNAKGRKDTIARLESIYKLHGIADLIDCGENEFYTNATNRILKEHANDIYFNYCPKCGNLTRTPKAKQCLKCKHNWHDKCDIE